MENLVLPLWKGKADVHTAKHKTLINPMNFIVEIVCTFCCFFYVVCLFAKDYLKLLEKIRVVVFTHVIVALVTFSSKWWIVKRIGRLLYCVHGLLPIGSIWYS